MDLIRFQNGFKITTNDIMHGEWQVGDDDLDVDPNRTTRGKLYRNRVVIAPNIEFTLVPFSQRKMKQLMQAVRPEKITVEFYYDSLDQWYRAEFYVSSNYRKPKPLLFKPEIIYQPHAMKFIGIYNMEAI